MFAESGMGKQCTVKCFYTSRLISVIYGVGSGFGGTRRSCFPASLYCSRSISSNIKGRNSHFDVSQQLLSPAPLRKTFTLQISPSPSRSLSSSLPLLRLATLLSFCFFSFLQSKQTSFGVIPHEPSLSASAERHSSAHWLPLLIAPCRRVMFKAPAPPPSRPSSSSVTHQSLKNNRPAAFISRGA